MKKQSAAPAKAPARAPSLAPSPAPADGAPQSLDALAATEAAGVLRAVIDAAKEGDMRACEIVLSRAWPARKGQPRAFELRAIESADDVAGAVGDVLKAVAGGRMTIDEGAAVADIIEARRKAIELIEFRERLEAVERRLARA